MTPRYQITIDTPDRSWTAYLAGVLFGIGMIGFAGALSVLLR